MPWAISVLLFALNAPPVATEGIRQLLDCAVSARRTWRFLRELSEIVVHSYPTWWRGSRIAIADDNFQHERTWARPRFGQYNTDDTNALAQVSARPGPRPAPLARPAHSRSLG